MNTATKTITLQDIEYWSGHSDEALADVIQKNDALGIYYASTGHVEFMNEAIGIAAAAFAQMASR